MNNFDIETLTPEDFERLIVLLLSKQGYETKHIPLGDDIGIDILAKKNGESIAVQVKKYDSRKINLAMVYHTFGAAAYYDCTRAIIITLSDITANAENAARKLNVEIIGKEALIGQIETLSITKDLLYQYTSDMPKDWFYDVWNTHIKSLCGREVKHVYKETFIKIIDVNNDGLKIINSNGKYRNYDIEIFRQVLTKLRNLGKITRAEINDNYQRRGASAISAVISTIPFVEKDNNPRTVTLKWKE